MSWVLLILRVIGWLLLGVLGLLLLAIILVLFVPVRYRMEGSYYEKPDVIVKLKWLFGVLFIGISFREGKLHYAVKLLGRLIKGTDYKPKEKKSKPKRRREKREKPVNRIPTKDEYTLEGFDEPAKPKVTSEKVSDEILLEDTDYEETGYEDTKEKPHFFDKLKEFVNKILDLLRNFESKLSALGKKLCSIKDNISYYMNLLTDDHVWEVLKEATGLVVRELRRMAPRKMKGQIHFGFDEPDSTGKALSVLAVLFPLYAGKITIHPEFEQSIFECELFMKGRFFIISVLICAWKLYFNKELRKVLKAFQKEEH